MSLVSDNELRSLLCDRTSSSSSICEFVDGSAGPSSLPAGALGSSVLVSAGSNFGVSDLGPGPPACSCTRTRTFRSYSTGLVFSKLAASMLSGSEGFGYVRSCGRKLSKMFTSSYIGDQVWLMTSKQMDPDLRQLILLEVNVWMVYLVQEAERRRLERVTLR